MGDAHKICINSLEMMRKKRSFIFIDGPTLEGVCICIKEIRLHLRKQWETGLITSRSNTRSPSMYKHNIRP